MKERTKNAKNAFQSKTFSDYKKRPVMRAKLVVNEEECSNAPEETDDPAVIDFTGHRDFDGDISGRQ